jgi:molybdenum cofactor guanylyltransferase
VDAADAAPLSAPPAIVAVLAGGRGERIGGEKPTRTLAGRALIDYPLAAAREARLETVVVAKRDTRLPPGLDARLICEPDEPRHPLAGALAALEQAAASSSERSAPAPVVLVGCDMPFLTGALLGWLAAAHDGAVLFELDGRRQPLPGRCLARHVPLLRDALAARAPLREALAALSPEVVDERELARFGDPRRLCFSVNRSEDLATAQRWLVHDEDGA